MTQEPLYRCDWCGARECHDRIWGVGRVGEWKLVKAESADGHLCENCISKFRAMFASQVEVKTKCVPDPAAPRQCSIEWSAAASMFRIISLALREANEGKLGHGSEILHLTYTREQAEAWAREHEWELVGLS